MEYGGTGFLVLYKEEGLSTCYLVTASHVARRVGPGTEVTLRVNKKDGTSAPFALHDVVWSYPKDRRIDIAATPCYLNPADWDVAYLSLNDMVNRRSAEQPFRVQCGDPISISGLFRLHSGTSRNTPIVHSGNIALLPDPNERIPVKDRVSGERLEMEAYLVEAQTLEGLSGAPVFQREMVALRMFPEYNGGPVIAATGVQLLGLYSGAWVGEPSSVLSEDKRLTPDRRVPVGMGVVVPCDFLLDLILTDEQLIKHRVEEKQRRGQTAEPVTDSALSNIC